MSTISEGTISIPIGMINSMPKRKVACCKNCGWQRKKFCSLRWESVQYDEVCSCHPMINPQVEEYLKELGKQAEEEIMQDDLRCGKATMKVSKVQRKPHKK